MGRTVYEALFGGDSEPHEDGSSTERFEDGSSITRDSDGDVRERTEPEYRVWDGDITVTYDGDGNEINRQPRG